MSLVESVKDAVGLGDHSDHGGSSPATASRQAMADARLPLTGRDSCAHLLIPLNQCRHKEYYLPWKCEQERHSYEKCQYEEFKKRVAKMDEIRAAANKSRYAGVAEPVPNSMTKSHATDPKDSVVPGLIQKVAPKSLEKALPEAVHPTEGKNKK